MDGPVLIVEDDVDTAEQFDAVLREDGVASDRCTSGRDALGRTDLSRYRLILLDLLLPGLDGLEVLRQIRLQRLNTPILVVSARSSETDRVLGLELGADDYLAKPISLVELRARVRALMRRVARLTEAATGIAERNERLVLGGLELEPHSRRAWRDGVELRLTAREFDLLALFVGARERVFTRAQLLEAVWHTRLAAYEDNVNTHIARLRRHVEADPANPRYILTVRGVGYRSASGDQAR